MRARYRRIRNTQSVSSEVAAAIVGAAAAIIGVVIGGYLDRAGEARRWRRDEVARAYAEYLAAADSFFTSIAVEDQGDRDDAKASFLRMTEAGARLDVFGHPDASETAHKCWNMANEWISDWDTLAGIEGDAWQRQASAYRELLVTLANQIRRHLGVAHDITLAAQVHRPVT
jgi:hypothetical protein